MVSLVERQVRGSVEAISNRLVQKENKLEEYYDYMAKGKTSNTPIILTLNSIEQSFLTGTQVDVSNWRTELTSKRGVTQVFSRMIELTLLKHDKRQAALEDDYERLQKEFTTLKIYLK